MTAPDSQPSTDPRPLSRALLGTWELRSREDHTLAGERRVDPSLGADPIAVLFYDRSGRFGAQFMKRDRSAAAGATPQGSNAGAPNNTGARDGYDAYFGVYTVDDARGTVTQRLTGALTPANVGMTLTRAMQVVGDELVIRLETRSVEGEPIVRTLRWIRVA